MKDVSSSIRTIYLQDSRPSTLAPAMHSFGKYLTMRSITDCFCFEDNSLFLFEVGICWLLSLMKGCAGKLCLQMYSFLLCHSKHLAYVCYCLTLVHFPKCAFEFHILLLNCIVRLCYKGDVQFVLNNCQGKCKASNRWTHAMNSRPTFWGLCLKPWCSALAIYKGDRQPENRKWETWQLRKPKAQYCSVCLHMFSAV